jgi:hypothetical protein
MIVMIVVMGDLHLWHMRLAMLRQRRSRIAEGEQGKPKPGEPKPQRARLHTGENTPPLLTGFLIVIKGA